MLGLGLVTEKPALGQCSGISQQNSDENQNPDREQEAASPAPDDLSMLDVLNRPVVDRQVYALVLKRGTDLIDRPDVLTAVELSDQLDERIAPSTVPFPGSRSNEELSPQQLYERMVQSSLIIGVTFDCGRCDKVHVNTAGAVLVGPGGLALTNYHVVEQQGDTKSIVAVAHNGKSYSIKEILSSSKEDDVALIRLAGDTSELAYCSIANANAKLMSEVHVISHPHRRYFVLTQGQISRYARESSRQRPDAVWMEITAEFGGGSSGSGVFNSNGEVVGLVSRIVPLIRRSSVAAEPATPKEIRRRRSDLTEVILRRCVPVEAIRNRFAR